MSLLSLKMAQETRVKGTIVTVIMIQLAVSSYVDDYFKGRIVWYNCYKWLKWARILKYYL